MNMTIMADVKWQPSVLHLLPFSKNNAGQALDTQSKVGGRNHRHKVQGEGDEGFPVLAVTRSEKRVKWRSKSASAPEESVAHSGTRGISQQHRLLRASSERLSRGHRGQHLPEPLLKARARSEHGFYSVPKRKHELVKCSVKDINDQILDQPVENIDNKRNNKNNNTNNNTIDKKKDSDIKNSTNSITLTPPPDAIIYKKDSEDRRVKPLLKPQLKSNEARWPQTHPRFWRSSTSSPGEMELRKHKINLDLNLGSHTRSARRVKLNVNDLPRSRTPVGENDPDKLNMKHVIEFLQTNARDETPNDGMGLSSYRQNLPVDTAPQKSLSGLGAGKNVLTQDKHHNSTSGRGDSSDSTPGDQFHGKKEYRLPKAKSKTYGSEMEHSSLTRNRNSNISKSSGLSQSSLKLTGRDDDEKKKPRPNTVLVYRDREDDVRIPEGIRKIRNNDDLGLKPFRLHRFLTLVPNGSESLLNPAQDKLSQNQFSSKSRSSSREKGRSVDKPQIHLLPNKTKEPQSDSLYFVNGNGVSAEDSLSAPRTKSGSRRRHARRVHTPGESSLTSQSQSKIICLPRAHFEPDSDDDNSPLSTVPNPRNNRALTLAAKGQAIIGNKGNFSKLPSVLSVNRPYSHGISTMSGLSNSDAPENKTTSFSVTERIVQSHGELCSEQTQYENNLAGNEELQPQDLLDSSNVGKDIPKNNHDNLNSAVTCGDLENGQPQILPEWARNQLQNSSTCNDLNLSHISSDGDNNNNNNNNDNNDNNNDNTVVSDLQTSYTAADNNFTLPEELSLADQKSLDPELRGSGNVGLNVTRDSRKVSSTSPSDHVKLSLRKERTLTRELTYMVDMGGASGDSSASRHQALPNSHG